MAGAPAMFEDDELDPVHGFGRKADLKAFIGHGWQGLIDVDEGAIAEEQQAALDFFCRSRDVEQQHSVNGVLFVPGEFDPLTGHIAEFTKLLVSPAVGGPGGILSVVNDAVDGTTGSNARAHLYLGLPGDITGKDVHGTPFFPGLRKKRLIYDQRRVHPGFAVVIRDLKAGHGAQNEPTVVKGE